MSRVRKNVFNNLSLGSVGWLVTVSNRFYLRRRAEERENEEMVEGRNSVAKKLRNRRKKELWNETRESRKQMT